MITIRFLLVVCGLLIICLFPQTAEANTLHAYNISQEGCECYQEGYLSRELWYQEKMQVISGIEFLLDRADNFAEYIDEDYSVDIDSIDYIYEAEEISNWLQEIVEEGEVAKHNATVSNISSNGSGMSNGGSYSSSSDGLTQSSGVYYYGGRKETYYNLDMGNIVLNAQALGIQGDYWIRNDGVKMYGDYVIVASQDRKGTIIETSLGTGIVLDYCPAGTIDIATNW